MGCDTANTGSLIFRKCALNCIQIQKRPFKSVHGWTFFDYFCLFTLRLWVLLQSSYSHHFGFVCVLILDYAVYIFHSTESRYAIFVLVDANHSKATWPLSTNSHVVACSTWLWRSDRLCPTGKWIWSECDDVPLIILCVLIWLYQCLFTTLQVTGASHRWTAGWGDSVSWNVIFLVFKKDKRTDYFLSPSDIAHEIFNFNFLGSADVQVSALL